MMKKGDKLR